jgi:hypothetical protein
MMETILYKQQFWPTHKFIITQRDGSFIEVSHILKITAYSTHLNIETETQLLTIILPNVQRIEMKK